MGGVVAKHDTSNSLACEGYGTSETYYYGRAKTSTHTGDSKWGENRLRGFFFL